MTVKKVVEKKEGSPEKKLKFKYLFLEDYHPEYVSGIFGGTTPNEDIVLNFFYERQGLPFEQTFIINPDGSLGNEVIDERDPSDLSGSLVRQVKSGVILNKKVAESVIKFLQHQIAKLEEVKAKREK